MRKRNFRNRVYFSGLMILCLFFVSAVSAQEIRITNQTTVFNFQGRLFDTQGQPEVGTVQMQFKLFDAATGGTEIATFEDLNVVLEDGFFTVEIDFGAAGFPGDDRFIQMAVRRNSGEPYDVFTTRQKLNSVPYSTRSKSSSEADTLASSCVGCVTDNQIQALSGSKIAGTIPVPSVPTGSDNYIQNTTTQQANSEFNISGIGKANIFDAITEFRINGNRFLSNAGDENTFTGINAGVVNTGFSNSFYGTNAGRVNTSGVQNSFFGTNAGYSNVSGSNNSFFGKSAGSATTVGDNSFFGAESGVENTIGRNNSFFGSQAGQFNISGRDNSFFGAFSGQLNRTGQGNSFFGMQAGITNTTGNFNTYLGFSAGRNMTGDFNICVGAFACKDNTGSRNTGAGFSAGGSSGTVGGLKLGQTDGSDNSVFGFESGKAVTDGSRNSFFGSKAGTANTGGFDNSYFGFEAGKTAQLATENAFFGSKAGSTGAGGFGNSFFGFETGMNTNNGGLNSFFGRNAGRNNTDGGQNSFFGVEAGRDNSGNDNSFFGVIAGRANQGNFNSFFGNSSGVLNQNGNENSFFGYNSGRSNLSGNGNTFVGSDSGDNNTSGSNNTFIGYKSSQGNVTGNNNTSIGANSSAGGNLSFATAIGAGSVVSFSNRIVLGRSGGQTDMVQIPGIVILENPSQAGATNLCWNNAQEISFCSSSMRYKTDITPFGSGLEFVRRFRPVMFKWKPDGLKDFGLIAEEVAEINPLLVTFNQNGEVEGVKYDRLGVVLLNAVNEQQTQIEEQKKQIEAQQKQIDEQKVVIDGLLKIVCAQNASAEICKEKK